MKHYARTQLLGVLTDRRLLPVWKKLPPRCEAVIKVDDEEFPVTAYNNLAEELAAVEEGTLLILKGDLKRVTWETGEGKKRERLVLEVTEMDRFRKKVKVEL